MLADMSKQSATGFDFSRLSDDPTYRRLVREDLEAAEGTPRSKILGHIQAMEFSLSLMEDALREQNYDTAAWGVTMMYDRLNELYLMLSPQDEAQASTDLTASND